MSRDATVWNTFRSVKPPDEVTVTIVSS